MAEALKSGGYDTSALVAAYVLKSRFGLDQGFDLYDDRLGYGEKLNDYDAEIPADRVYQKFQGLAQPSAARAFFSLGSFLRPPQALLPRRRISAGSGRRPLPGRSVVCRPLRSAA